LKQIARENNRDLRLISPNRRRSGGHCRGRLTPLSFELLQSFERAPALDLGPANVTGYRGSGKTRGLEANGGEQLASSPLVSPDPSHSADVNQRVGGSSPMSFTSWCRAVGEFAGEAKPAAGQLLPRCPAAGLAFRANPTNRPLNITLPRYTPQPRRSRQFRRPRPPRYLSGPS
jgi:hypothetical protein